MVSDIANLAEESTKGSFILVSGTLIATVISAVASILIARFLGPDNYGIYSLSLVVPQIFFLITDFGIREGIIKFTIEARAKGQTSLGIKIIKYGLLIRTLAGIISFLVLFVSADLIAKIILQRPNLGVYIRIASVAVIFQAIYTTVTHAYIGLDKTIPSSIITQIQSLAKAMASILLVILGFSITGAVLGYVFGFISAGIISITALLLYFKKIDKPIDSEKITPALKKLVKYGTPLYFSVIMIGFMPQFIDILLAFFASNYDIGNFKATANFILLLTIIAQQLTISFLPAFTKLNDASIEQRKSFFSISHKYTTLIILPLTMLLIVFSNEIVQFAYGPTYTNAGFFLSIYAFLYFMTGLGYLNLPSLFNGMGKTRETLKMNTITFLVVLAIAPFTTNYFGITGLIITILIAYVLGSIYGMYAAKRTLEITFDLKILSKIYLIALLSVIPSIMLVSDLTPIPKMLLGTGVYLFIYLTLVPFAKIVTSSEMKLLNQFIAKIKPLYILKPLLRYHDKILQLTKN